ncbi:MAG: hypothetical protein LIO77_00585 [Rikenellaceae bacterium]|nr:hypothetical protein [Rikenellaceae bacterium]
MKIKTLLLLLSAFAFSACSDDDCKGEPKEAHYGWMEFAVTDSNGEDLLEDNSEGSFLWGISIRFANKVYTYRGELIDFGGIRLRVYYDDPIGKSILAFGPLSSDDNLRKEKITVDWGDGSEPDQYLVDLYTDYINCEAQRHTAFYSADGKQVEVPVHKVIE